VTETTTLKATRSPAAHQGPGAAATYLYYPGCSLHATAEEYDASTRAVLGALGLGLEEVEDWNCCGATPAHASSDFLAAALPLRNLIRAERQLEGSPDLLPEVLVPCAACYNAFRLADHHVRRGGEAGRRAAGEVEAIVGRSYRGEVTVRHPLEVLGRREALTALSGLIRRPLKGLKVACYYGCLLVRPSQVVSFEDDPEHPQTMDRLLAAVGAEPVSWSYKTDCCGQSMAVAERELVTELSRRIVRAARAAGARALVTACPLCHMNLDSRQGPGPAGEAPLPVFFYTELLALALGVGRPEAWFRRHLVDVRPALAGLGGLEARDSA